jgi:hypothetical protein
MAFRHLQMKKPLWGKQRLSPLHSIEKLRSACGDENYCPNL